MCAKNLLRCPKREKFLSDMSLKDFEGPGIYCQRHFHGEKLAEQEMIKIKINLVDGRIFLESSEFE